MSSLYAVVLDFGYPENPDALLSITDLAQCAQRNYWQNPDVLVLAQSCTYEYLAKRKIFPEERLLKIEVGQSNTNGLAAGGSYHVLKRASKMIRERAGEDYDEVVEIVAHELHLPRVLRQAGLFGLTAKPGGNLPTNLYATAAQWWCRKKYLWYFREMVGYVPLKLSGQL